MPQNVEACEWLTQTLRSLEPPHLDNCYMNMRAVSTVVFIFSRDISESFSPINDYPEFSYVQTCQGLKGRLFPLHWIDQPLL